MRLAGVPTKTMIQTWRITAPTDKSVRNAHGGMSPLTWLSGGRGSGGAAAPRCGRDHGTVDCSPDEGRYQEPATVNEVTARPRCALLLCAKPRPQKGGERDLPPCTGDGRHSSRGGARVAEMMALISVINRSD